MKKIIPVILVFTIPIIYINHHDDFETKNEIFTKELMQLKAYFHLPGLSVIIKKRDQIVYENYIGFADSEKQIALDSTTYDDLTLMHNLSYLKATALHSGHDVFVNFDKQLKEIGLRQIVADIDNPYANYYLAKYYEEKNHADSALLFYNRIANAKNFSGNWYTSAAENWIKGQKK